MIASANSFGFAGAGVVMANWYWYVITTWRSSQLIVCAEETDCHRYGFHVPRTVARDNFYSKLEEKRASEKQEQ